MIKSLLVCLSIWIILDGIGSILLYKKQSIPEHSIRVFRIVIGIIMLIDQVFNLKG